MTFFQFSAPLAGQKYDYPTLGFFAVDSAILDGAASNPQITAAPDAHWTVVAGQHSSTRPYTPS